LFAPSPPTSSRSSRDISSLKNHSILNANSSYQKILFHSHAWSLEFPLAVYKLCSILHVHLCSICSTVCLLLICVLSLSRPNCNQAVLTAFETINLLTTYLVSFYTAALPCYLKTIKTRATIWPLLQTPYLARGQRDVRLSLMYLRRIVRSARTIMPSDLLNYMFVIVIVFTTYLILVAVVQSGVCTDLRRF